MTRTVGKKYGENGGHDKQHLERHSVESRATIFMSGSRLGNCVKTADRDSVSESPHGREAVVPSTVVDAAALAAYEYAGAEVHAAGVSAPNPERLPRSLRQDDGRRSRAGRDRCEDAL